MTKSPEGPPPAYSANANANVSSSPSDAPPPNYTPLTKFTIGRATTTEPLVSIAEIKGHLALLHAFTKLKKQVQALDVEVPHLKEDKEKKWTWFVGLAVERFDLWCRSLKADDAKKPWDVVLPPIDVLMVWHAYMLNPRWYAEDCMRITACQTLRAFEPHFKTLLQDPSFLSEDDPSKERLAFWVWTTQMAGFDPLEEARVIKKKVVICPRCYGGNEVDFVNQEGTGYFQRNFRTTCVGTTCFGLELGCPGFKISKETLALRKLVENLAERDESWLPGTLFTSSPLDKEKGRKIKQKIYDEGKLASVHHTQQNKYGLIAPIMEYCSYSLAKLREQMGAKEQPLLIERIMNAYSDEKIYSVELVGAVLRQGSFVSKMHELGWTLPGFFDHYADELALHHALARYHAFLDLMSSSPASFFVPTLDIDLVWHTHQLMPGKYDADCKECLQRFIDHDDKVESMKLSSAFDITCRAWKERFRVQYTHCGCAIPGDTIGQRLSRMVGVHTRPLASSSHLVPADRPDILAATHASDHNAVRFVSTNLTAHRLLMMRSEVNARKKMKQQQELANKKAAKQRLEARIEELKAAKRGPGLFGSKSSVPPPSQRPRDNDEENHQTQRYSHEAPFLIPVPLFFGGGIGGGGGGCVSSNGHSVSAVGACSNVGTGAGGCGGTSNAGGCGNTSGGSGGGCDPTYNSGSSSGGCGGGSGSGGANCGGGSGGGGSGCGGGGGGCGGGGGGGGCGGC